MEGRVSKSGAPQKSITLQYSQELAASTYQLIEVDEYFLKEIFDEESKG